MRVQKSLNERMAELYDDLVIRAFIESAAPAAKPLRVSDLVEFVTKAKAESKTEERMILLNPIDHGRLRMQADNFSMVRNRIIPLPSTFLGKPAIESAAVEVGSAYFVDHLDLFNSVKLVNLGGRQEES
jgi:hypothetical protein